jgi:hypothetical protein
MKKGMKEIVGLSDGFVQPMYLQECIQLEGLKSDPFSASSAIQEFSQ